MALLAQNGGAACSLLAPTGEVFRRRVVLSPLVACRVMQVSFITNQVRVVVSEVHKFDAVFD